MPADVNTVELTRVILGSALLLRSVEVVILLKRRSVSVKAPHTIGVLRPLLIKHRIKLGNGLSD